MCGHTSPVRSCPHHTVCVGMGLALCVRSCSGPHLATLCVVAWSRQIVAWLTHGPLWFSHSVGLAGLGASVNHQTVPCIECCAPPPCAAHCCRGCVASVCVLLPPAAECDALIAAAAPNMQPSKLATGPDTRIRTSTNTFLPRQGNELITGG